VDIKRYVYRPSAIVCYLLEEEVVLDELGLSLLVHALEGVEGTLEIALEGLESWNNLVHDLESLLLGKSGAKREVSEVTADSDSGRNDHSGILSGQGRSVKLLGVHIGNVLGTLSVLVVVLNNLVEEGSKDLVAVVRASIDTDAGIGVLASGEDGLSEGEAVLILLVLKLVPNLSWKVLHEEWFGSLGEGREINNVLRISKLRSNGGSLVVANLDRLLAILWCSTTHCFICLFKQYKIIESSF
jgi:hypothetical protein